MLRALWEGRLQPSWELGAAPAAGSTVAHPHPLAVALSQDARGGSVKTTCIFPRPKKLPVREFALDLGKGVL